MQLPSSTVGQEQTHAILIQCGSAMKYPENSSPKRTWYSVAESMDTRAHRASVPGRLGIKRNRLRLAHLDWDLLPLASLTSVTLKSLSDVAGLDNLNMMLIISMSWALAAQPPVPIGAPRPMAPAAPNLRRLSSALAA